MRNIRAVIALLLTVALSGTAIRAADGDAPRPMWIWSAADRTERGDAAFSTSLVIKELPVSAELWVAADFARLTVVMNDRPLAEVEAYESPVELDVSGLIQRGPNSLCLQSSACPGPSAVAARLVIRQAGAAPISIVTDTTWRVKSDGAVDQQALGFGTVAEVPWLIPAASTQINPFDDYTQWNRALGASDATQPTTFQIEDGFEIEMLRSAAPDEGSWVSMAFDPQGRLVIGKEDRGLLRITLSPDDRQVSRVELIDDQLEECRGLLFAFDALYVNANNSLGLYRLRDTNGDDRYDEVKLLYRSTGGVGHGRNDLALGPDNRIYSIHGDAVDLPQGFADRTSPFREHRRGVETREGHVIRTDSEGETWELLAAGLRNPFGIAFNTDGEMFTYDADAEFDMGSPWYRPTRVDHLVPGSDFGWRGVTGRWPPYFPDHPDNAPYSLNIGKGSPTAVEFGYESRFPEPLRSALFILDWAYGRILAVHMAPRGASYFCRAEPFLRGRPLNVTDLACGPDGALYFVTGGRKTHSGLYRVRYVGPPREPLPPSPQQQARGAHARAARALRRELESLHRPLGAAAVAQAWPHLDSADPWIRHAARVAAEHQPLDLWRERALEEPRRTASLTAWLALARSQDLSDREPIVARLLDLPLDELTTQQKQIALYTCSLCDATALDAPLAARLARRLEPLYPDRSSAVNRQLSQLLIELNVASVVPRTLERMQQASDQADQLHCLFVLRNAKHGWTPEHRRTYFAALGRTESYLGGQGMPGFLETLRSDALAALTAEQRQIYEPLLEAGSATQTEQPPRPFVKSWTLAELLDSSDSLAGRRDFERGRQMYAAALCDRCHRLGTSGTPIGPDLTSVASRFSRRDLLESILFPSQVIAENYRSQRIITVDGKVLEGRVIYAGDYRSPQLKIATNPLLPHQTIEIEKSEIEAYSPSPVSFMPQGLLDTLQNDEILDLLAYIEAGGEADTGAAR